MSIPADDLGNLVRTILFLLFGDLTAIISAVIGPTYDNLLVPSLQTGALYPPVLGGGGGSDSYLAVATQFSLFLLSTVVDPLIALLALGVAGLYLCRSIIARWASTLDALLPRLVIGVVAANFTVPIAGAILGVASNLFPVIADWDGGAWQHWANLAGWGQVSFSWDNGALAFLLSFAEFAAVFALLLAVGIRDALLAVLVVLLPLFTLLWPLRPLSPLARRGWLLFAELAFLPCVLVIPLELAVGSPNPVMLTSYLAVAIAAPYLLSLAGTHLVAFGVAGASSVVHGGAQRGLASTSAAGSAKFGPLVPGPEATDVSRTASTTLRTAGSAAAPAAAPIAVTQALGHGSRLLLEHIHRKLERTAPTDQAAARPGGVK